MAGVVGFLKHIWRALAFPLVEGWENTDLEWHRPGWAAHMLEAAVKQREKRSAGRHGLKGRRESKTAL
jgi:hypothetical protein